MSEHKILQMEDIEERGIGIIVIGAGPHFGHLIHRHIGAVGLILPSRLSRAERSSMLEKFEHCVPGIEATPISEAVAILHPCADRHEIYEDMFVGVSDEDIAKMLGVVTQVKTINDLVVEHMALTEKRLDFMIEEIRISELLTEPKPEFQKAKSQGHCINRVQKVASNRVFKKRFQRKT